MEGVTKKMNSMLLENPPSGDLSVLFFFFLRGDFVLLSEIEISVIWDLSEAEREKKKGKIWRKVF